MKHKAPPRPMMLTTACPICDLNLEVDDIVIATIYPQQQNIPDDKGKRVPRVVAMMKPTLHFDCMLAQRLQDIGMIVPLGDDNAPTDTPDGTTSDDSSDARTPDKSSTSSIPTTNPETDASLETNNDGTD